MRVIIKGGVWKNTEDEILKAAVMKYGKNQWARISSLLTRKTPKQCKARWYEWLDPSIKKTEWSKEEDEKLLHLAKLMPTQWRTIAPIVGRTPAQCLERYQKLLDEAESKEGMEGEAGPSADDVRKLRPGEIDPDPEVKPARPDPVDMDEDEKEMLSEARARLANTQGKKAKRKAREKQLEEARRLAALQKRRELKAAGIDVRERKKRKGMDFNADIPFEIKPAPGFFDTSEEMNRPRDVNKTNILLSKLDGKRKAELEEEERKKDIKRLKTKKEKGGDGIAFVPGSGNKTAADLFKAPAAIDRRKKLALPAPQISEAELEEIVKIGYAGESAKSVVETDNDVTGTTSLLGNYSTVNTGLPTRTPRTAPGADTIRQEASNQLAMMKMQTPLLGEQTPHLSDGTGFSGVTPSRQVHQTPNPIAVQMTPRGSSSTPRSTVSSTPRFGAGGSVGGTPYRDEMGINTPRSTFESTPRNQKTMLQSQRTQLSRALASLPKPKNDFQIVVPSASSQDESESDPAAKLKEQGTSVVIPDAADIAAAKLAQQKAIEAEKEAKKSEVLKRGLPRPLVVPSVKILLDKSYYVAEGEVESEKKDKINELKQAEEMVIQEMVELIKKEMREVPVIGGVPPPPSTSSDIDDFKLKELKSAEELIRQEMEEVTKGVELVDLLDKYRQGSIDREVDEMLKKIDGRYEGAVWDVKSNEWVNLEDEGIDDNAKMGIYKSGWEANRTRMAKEAQRAIKMEKKLGIVFGGYQHRSNTLLNNIKTAYGDLNEALTQLQSFKFLSSLEETSTPLRIGSLTQEVEDLARREKQLQTRWVELKQIRDELSV
ncbi:pre-mRNA splicing factor component-domain-containing protein [Paraphysoderma sedebokerense]|nr:pre-mRNA splicing factor component-domain-containing protein [Paraphysoderma sedebokerense]